VPDLSPQRAAVLGALTDRILALRRAHPVRVAVDGVDASGKTVLAGELAAAIAARGRTVIHASIDGFHRPRAERLRRGDDSPEGFYLDSFDHAAAVACLLAPLGPGGSRRFRRAAFDSRTDAPVDAPLEEAPADAVLVVDGIFLQRPELDAHWDYRVFVKASFETTVARAEVRDAFLGDPAAVRERYARRYVPGQRLYLEACQPEARADAVVENDDPAAPALLFRAATGA
jgi:uridine kinase